MDKQNSKYHIISYIEKYFNRYVELTKIDTTNDILERNYSKKTISELKNDYEYEKLLYQRYIYAIDKIINLDKMLNLIKNSKKFSSDLELSDYINSFKIDKLNDYIKLNEKYVQDYRFFKQYL